MTEQRYPVGTLWWVGFDNERIAKFDSEDEAIQFAHIDGQLEGVTAIVIRVDSDGTRTLVYEEIRA